jgi:hypothetical protein
MSVLPFMTPYWSNRRRMTSTKPCVGRTKNGVEARQYIQADLAAELRQLVANKTPATSVFNMPSEWDVAGMLRGDLAAARKQWLDEVKHDPDARARREESDFLQVANRDGEVLNFHALRHTTGAWLALQGQHVSVIKTVMRHSNVSLSLDAYGHLLPDQHADAIGGMAAMMNSAFPLAATGTEPSAAPAVGTAVGTRNRPKPSEPVRTDSSCDKEGEMPQTLEIIGKTEVFEIETEERPLPDSNRGWRICNP